VQTACGPGLPGPHAGAAHGEARGLKSGDGCSDPGPMRRILLAGLLVAAAVVGWQQYFRPPPGFGVSNDSDAARPIVVRIHSAASGASLGMGPTWSGLDARVGDGARLVVLDVSDPERRDEAERIARYMGIGGFLSRYQRAPGTIAVLHGSTREPVAVFQGEKSFARYLGAIDKARRS